jgi:hypothetical protein
MLSVDAYIYIYVYILNPHCSTQAL